MMELTMLKAKIHRACVTQVNMHYQGSVTVDSNLLKAAGILANERVEVYNINNGQRFTTYAITGETGSGIIGVNGAAARLVAEGDRLIICAFVQMSVEEAETHDPKVIILDEANNIQTTGSPVGVLN